MAYDFDSAKVATKPKSEIVVDMMAALHKLDAPARDMERKWGSCRLPALVPEELARRFYSQHRKVSMAMREGRNQDALHEIARMMAAWRYLDQEADRLGAEPIHPAVWEVALSDGTVVAIVQDEDSAAAVDPQERAMKVYLLSEVARLIEAMPTVMAIKEQWPGAKVVPTRTITADSYWWRMAMSCPSDQACDNRLHRNISPEPVWTPKLVEARLAEAAAVLKRLPTSRVRGYFNTWPDYSHEFADLVGQEPRETSLPPPSPAAISRMEETLTWTMGLDPIDGKIVWMRAHSVPWKATCWRVGLRRSAANERWVYALCVIALKLNRQPLPRKRSRRYVIEWVRDFAGKVLSI